MSTTSDVRVESGNAPIETEGKIRKEKWGVELVDRIYIRVNKDNFDTHVKVRDCGKNLVETNLLAKDFTLHENEGAEVSLSGIARRVEAVERNAENKLAHLDLHDRIEKVENKVDTKYEVRKMQCINNHQSQVDLVDSVRKDVGQLQEIAKNNVATLMTQQHVLKSCKADILDVAKDLVQFQEEMRNSDDRVAELEKRVAEQDERLSTQNDEINRIREEMRELCEMTRGKWEQQNSVNETSHHRFESIDERGSNMERDLGDVNGRIEGLVQRETYDVEKKRVDERFDSIEEDVAIDGSRLDEIETRMDDLETNEHECEEHEVDMYNVKKDVEKIIDRIADIEKVQKETGAELHKEVEKMTETVENMNKCVEKRIDQLMDRVSDIENSDNLDLTALTEKVSVNQKKVEEDNLQVKSEILKNTQAVEEVGQKLEVFSDKVSEEIKEIQAFNKNVVVAF